MSLLSSLRQVEEFFTTDGEMKKSGLEETMLGDVFDWLTPDEHIAQRGFRNSFTDSRKRVAAFLWGVFHARKMPQHWASPVWIS
jgi:hypothetical protein